jgi:hypothetical protein
LLHFTGRRRPTEHEQMLRDVLKQHTNTERLLSQSGTQHLHGVETLFDDCPPSPLPTFEDQTDAYGQGIGHTPAGSFWPGGLHVESWGRPAR